MNKTIKEILEILESHGFSAYVVGGYVRDFLVGKETNDIDICTNATTQELKEIFAGGKTNEYGVFTLKTNDFTIDITTFRRERNYKNRRPSTVFYIEDLQTDLLRRDFTINTICMDKNEQIIDELNGREDIQNKIIRMVGDVNTKIEEDPLRILRAIRLAAILDFSLEATLEEAIQKNRMLLCTLSPYRMKEEISKILLSPNYKIGLHLLVELQLCEVLGISFTNVTYTNDLCGMWAQIEFQENLPFTKNEKENIIKIREILETKMVSLDTVYEYGLYLSLVAGEILGISSEAIHKMHENIPIYTKQDLEISYLEICEVLGLAPSNEVKEIESELIHEVLYEHIPNTKQELRNYLIANKKRWKL